MLVAGGQNGIIFIASAERYNPSTGAWTTTGSLHTPRIEHAEILLPNGQVLVVGGLDSNYNYLASAELYTPWNTHISRECIRLPALFEPGRARQVPCEKGV